MLKYYKNKPWLIEDPLFSDPTTYLRKVAIMMFDIFKTFKKYPNPDTVLIPFQIKE